MSTFFVPYVENKPVCFDIKGHKLVIVAAEKQSLQDELEELGGDDIRELTVKDEGMKRTDSDWLSQAAFIELAESVKGGVILAPAGIAPSAIMDTLERELPWIH